VRLLDQDVIDLYNRVSIGTHVIVIGDPDLMRASKAAVASAAPIPAGPVSAPIAADALFPPAGAPVPPASIGPA
jgi:hypothetical protein